MIISVGRVFPMFSFETFMKFRGTDGAILEATENDNGFWFHMMLNQPSFEEVRSVSEETIQVRIYKESDKILPMIRFGEEYMIYEMSFDPTLYTDGRALQISKTNNLLNIILINTVDGIVKAKRTANFPLKFIQIAAEVWAKAFLQTNYSEQYAAWYKGLQSHSIESLWNRATEVGEMGEVFNLEEVHYKPDSQYYR